MQHGTPCIVSNLSAIPEVCGEAVIYCDPFSLDSIEADLLKVLSVRIDGSRMRRQLAAVSDRQQSEMHDLTKVICEDSPEPSQEQIKLHAI